MHKTHRMSTSEHKTISFSEGHIKFGYTWSCAPRFIAMSQKTVKVICPHDLWDTDQPTKLSV